MRYQGVTSHYQKVVVGVNRARFYHLINKITSCIIVSVCLFTFMFHIILLKKIILSVITNVLYLSAVVISLCVGVGIVAVILATVCYIK